MDSPMQSRESFVDAQSTISEAVGMDPPSNGEGVLDAAVDDTTKHASPRQKTCILVIGPSGSGKSTFVAAASGLGEDSGIIGHDLDSHTSTCSRYTFDHGEVSYTLLDTPGFNDTNRDDLAILAAVAGFLDSDDMPPVSGVVFTHNITENRLTGSARLNLAVLAALCGPHFGPRIILLTTMWNKMPSAATRAECERREAQLAASPAHWGRLSAGGCSVLRFDGTTASALRVLDQLRGLPGAEETAPPLLAMVSELREGKRLEETSAGGVILEERRRREKQRENELMEIAQEEEERLRAERARAARMARQEERRGREQRHNRGSHHQRQGSSHASQLACDGAVAGNPVPYEVEDPMAYSDQDMYQRAVYQTAMAVQVRAGTPHPPTHNTEGTTWTFRLWPRR
ncbi:hypothetical protein QBC47DRAFT_359555 [Echria macrotheca]|uniref:G domain-containing protein n=1 Tax=Echria macrotheca TaxID=438768 RepID=A0AAJ0BH48_9PEZI|nr:hypothetical protein QBC47DRAFT_359555 [Echria macrotheca]